MPYPIDLTVRPAGFEPLPNEPEFDADKHLALEPPDHTLTLVDLGYDADARARCPSDFAASSVFRVLSEEGAACLYEVVKLLEHYVESNERIERCVRGGVYRSAFLRDLCLNPDITAMLSEMCGLQLMPHTIPHQLGHLNYNPKTIGQNVDKWHVDTLRFDYVLFVTDPNAVDGGAFQYFKGTKDEIATLKQRGESVPADRIISPDMPGAGYAVFQQGNMVVHQAKGLNAPGERITMVNGYVPSAASFPDFTRYDQLALVDPPHVVAAEYARHIAHQSRRLLDDQLAELSFSHRKADYAGQLDAVAEMLQQAAVDIREGDSGTIEHFGD